MLSIKQWSSLPLLLAFFVLLVSQGCDITSTDTTGTSEFDVQFAVASSQNASGSGNAVMDVLQDSMMIDGSNGTLTIQDVHFVVSEFKLERDEEGCESDTTDSDDEGDVQNEQREEECEEKFETSGIFVDLPLDGSPIDVVDGSITEGTYSELKFEVEDIDFDEEGDEDEEGSMQGLVDSVKAQFPNWPSEASMVVSGTFRESGSDSSRSFQTFVEAEIEIEKEFETPLSVTADEVPQELRISLHPDVWFKRSDGTVRDLSKYNYQENGELLELEVELENGFGELEIEEDYDDEDDGDDDDNDEEDEGEGDD